MVDIDDMQKNNELFKRKLKGLAELSDYGTGKLGIYEDATYISWNYFQGIQRRFYGENSDSLITFLNRVIEDYYIYYNMIIFFILLNNDSNDKKYANRITLSEKISDEDIEKLYYLQSENEKFIHKLYNGLLILKFQYESIDEKRNSINVLMHKVRDLIEIYNN